MNWAQLSSLMIVFAGALGGLVGARDAKAGVAATILFVFGGFLIGLVVGEVSGRLANSVLNSKRTGDAIKVVAYLVLPIPFLIGTVILAACLVELAAHLF